MAEPLGWLKLGPRSQTPSTSRPASSPERKTKRDSQPTEVQRPASSRMSSHFTPSECGPEPTPVGPDPNADNLRIRGEDQVWYNPSLDQMVEALQVRLMTRGLVEPIPVEYNSYVIHLVEGLASAQEKIGKMEANCEEMKLSLERNFEQFRLVADEWVERETQYRVEVKRLEVLLSKSSQDGLAAVVLARTNSVVSRGNSERAEFLSRLGKYRKPQVHDQASPSCFPARGQIFQTETEDGHIEKGDIGIESTAPGRVLTPRILDDENDFLVSEKFRRQDAVDKIKSLPSGARRTHRYHEISRPKVSNVRRHPKDFDNPFATLSAGPAIAEEGYHANPGVPRLADLRMRDVASIGSSYPKVSHHGQDISRISATDSTNYANGARCAAKVVAHKVTPIWKQDHARFSFEHRDDFDSPPSKPTESVTNFDMPSTEDSPLQTALGSQETIVFRSSQHYTEHTNGLPSTSLHGDAQSPSADTNYASVQYCLNGVGTPAREPGSKPVPTTQERSYGRQATMGRPSSRSNHHLDSQSATSISGQEIMQRQQAETDASIAARVATTLAITDAQLDSGRKK